MQKQETILFPFSFSSMSMNGRLYYYKIKDELRQELEEALYERLYTKLYEKIKEEVRREIWKEICDHFNLQVPQEWVDIDLPLEELDNPGIENSEGTQV